MSRKLLLSPAITDLKLWNELVEIIDEVWKDNIDDPQKLMLLLRDTYPFSLDEVNNTEEAGLYDIEDLYPFPKAEYMRNADMLGFQFSASFFNRQDFQLIYSTYASYLPERMTEASIDYFSFVLNAVFVVEKLWSEIENNKYVNFLPEEVTDPLQPDQKIFNPDIVPFYEGGTYFPTTHVDLRYDFAKFGLFTPYNVRNFFDYIANLPIVLNSIIFDSRINVRPFNLAIKGQMTITYV